VPVQRSAMNRRAFAGGLGSLLAGLPEICLAEPSPRLDHWRYWKFIPSIAIVSNSDDPRIPAVHDAVGFWNDVFSNVGSPFRLGPVVHFSDGALVDQIRWDDRAFSGLLLQSRPRRPDDIQQYSDRLFDVGIFSFFAQATKGQGDVIVALSDGRRSFAISSRSPRKELLVIRRFRTYETNPPTMLNGSQDTIAHELGHAIGLDHNKDPMSLMCNPCEFAERDGFGPLTEREKALLLRMYPSSWREERL
jgi:hypothetical protein